MHKKHMYLITLLSIGMYTMIQSNETSKMHYKNTSTFPTKEPGIARSYTLNEFRICATEVTKHDLETYLNQLTQACHFTLLNNEQSVVIFSNNEPNENEYTFSGTITAKEGSIQIYYWHKPRLLTVDVHALKKEITNETITQITKQYFGLIESTELTLSAKNLKQQNSKVQVRTDSDLGRGVFAKEDIKKGEFIGGLYGKFHEAKDCMSLPEKYRDHVMQCAEHFWRGNKTTNEAVQYLNHSCVPNCGVQGLFDFVAMRDIAVNEELTTDYAMQDDSNWVVPGGECLCGAKNCRSDILPYRDLTAKEKKEYNSYVSHWILHRYNICSCTE